MIMARQACLSMERRPFHEKNRLCDSRVTVPACICAGGIRSQHKYCRHGDRYGGDNLEPRSA